MKSLIEQLHFDGKSLIPAFIQDEKVASFNDA
jgi:hypothetical protein